MTHYAVVLGSAAIGAIAGWFVGKSQRFAKARQILRGNESWMSEQELCIVAGLIAAGHGHLLSHWPPPGVDDESKRDLVMMILATIKNMARDLEKFRLAIIRPPSPSKTPYYMVAHGDVRDDPFYWMRDDFRKNPTVLSHLKKENLYAKAVMSDMQQLQSMMIAEMRQRIPDEDISAPLRLKNYYYYTKTLKSKPYKIHCRRQVPPNAGPASVSEVMDVHFPEEIMLDVNKEARGSSFFHACGLKVSPDESLLAYFQDTKGFEFYTLKIKQIPSGRHLMKNEIQKASNQCEWSNNSTALFYLTVDAMGRPYQVWRHFLDESVENDVCIYTEPDAAFFVSLAKTRDHSTICIVSESTQTRECRVLNANNPESEVTVVLPRNRGVKYWLEHYKNSYFFRIQDQNRPNSEIAIASVDNPADQTTLVPCHPDLKIEDFIVSSNYLTVFCRRNGLQAAFVYTLPADIEITRSLGAAEELTFEEPPFTLKPGPQGDFDSEVLRLIFTSLVTPESVVDQNLRMPERSVKKMESVLGGYDATHYKSERTWALADDGTRIPISVVFRKDAIRRNGADPLLLEVYGAYERSLNPSFSSERLSLLQRGFVYAIAHVRGGGEMGRAWYEDGRLLNKQTTFTDVIACAGHLVEKAYCSPSRICLCGNEAGGLAVAATVNMRPDLFCAAVLHSPSVDLLTSMRDADVPLTAEYSGEWGNLLNEEDYKYIKSYSPIDNIAQKEYPHMLLTAGYREFRVGYWEPAKFAAKIREYKTNSSMVVFNCDMSLGEFSRNTKSQKLEAAALDYAFLIKAIGHLPLERMIQNGAL